MGNFYQDVICQDPRFHSTDGCRDLALLEPSFRAQVEALIADAAAQGIKLWATETYRSQERQQMLFVQKLTQLSKVGVHHYGLACDFAMSKDGGKTADWTIQDWSDVLGPLAMKHGLVWGGDWQLTFDPQAIHQPGFHDCDHVQAIEVKDQAQLFAGTWYPEAGSAAAEPGPSTAV
jgi:hypothetical protein